MEKEKRDSKFTISNEEKAKEKNTEGLQLQQDEQILIEKHLRNKQRQIADLKGRSERYNDELAIMMKTDMLVRDRLDFKKQADRINEANKRNIEESRDNLVYRSRSGSRIRGAHVQSAGFVDQKEQGQKILGAIDANLLNPFKVRQDITSVKNQDEYYGSIKSDQVHLSNKYSLDKIQKLKDEVLSKENSLKYKYAQQDQELRIQATRRQQEVASQRAQINFTNADSPILHFHAYDSDYARNK